VTSKETPRLARVLQIYGRLLAGEEINCDDLSARFQIGRRTTMRDLAAIRKAGVRLVFDRQKKTYRIDSLDSQAL
jgi:predicted DNA-binding transcriptional regulator YafY